MGGAIKGEFVLCAKKERRSMKKKTVSTKSLVLFLALLQGAAQLIINPKIQLFLQLSGDDTARPIG